MAVSSALIREEDYVQLPLYHTSQALRGPEERHPSMENLAYALIMASCKLRPYFQAHSIVFQIDKPLRKTMNNPEAVGRLVLWVIELNEFDVL